MTRSPLTGADRRTVLKALGALSTVGIAYGPSAVAVSSGTEVLWEWTGEGGAHNVEAEPDEQIGESDYEFSSGDPVDGADNEYSYTFDESGIALYHCEPHLSLGMKGSIVVD